MTIRPKIIGGLAAGCIAALALPQQGGAVTDDEFNALKDLVNKQGQRIEQLEKAHNQDQQTIEQSKKLHEEDQQQLQQLKQQVGETQKTATEAQQKAEATAQAQEAKPAPGEGNALQNFMVVGDAEVQFGKVDSLHSAFALADFAPIFLFRARDNVLFEAGFDVTLSNGSNGATPPHDSGSSTSVSLSFATLDYIINNWATFVGGDMLLPLGTYSERSAGWLNKFPDNPLMRDIILPGSGVGGQLRGSLPIGSSGQSFAYSVYCVNGPSSSDGTAAHDQLDLGGNVGILNNGKSGSLGNLHGTPSAGGRLGWFYPWKAHYDIELGISGQSGTWDDNDNYLWSAAVLDGALHFGPYVEVKGEYAYTWLETSDQGTLNPRGWYVQAGYKLAGLNLDVPVVSNLELVGRYDDVHDNVGGRGERYTLGYVYYFSNTLLFEGDYEFANGNNDALNHNAFIFQLSYGF